ncbi:hypothetical protein GA0074692_3754 [Micromonospora pallida]|uniref:CdiA toxin EC869-like domain-containing protein n=1 Tax=Micromonospora pallida TaxID=145854 RepID=A0A1C6SX46_9ACTN|nr:hypothetical protein GA0074692_3754 [Micromonospora pallida]
MDKVAGFAQNGASVSHGGTTITGSQVTGRALDLAVPRGGTAAQQAALNNIVQYGASRGVTVRIIPVR